MSAYRGYFEYGGLTIANSTRTFDLLTGAAPSSELPWYTFVEDPEGLFYTVPLFTEAEAGLFAAVPGIPESPTGLFWTNEGQASCGFCGNIQVGYRDDWPGIADWLGEAGTYGDLSTAPWIDPMAAVSHEFRGVMVMSVNGLDQTPIDRGIAESICTGGVASAHRDTTRRITFDALIVGCSHAGARYGLNWLTCALREGKNRQGLPLRFLMASPEGTSATADELVRTVEDVVLTSAPAITGFGRGYGGAQNRHSNLLRVQWEMTALNPYLWTDPVATTPMFTSSVTETIEWVTGCVGGDPGCPVPVDMLIDPLCVSPELPVTVNPPVLGCESTTTAACIPLCSGTRLSANYNPLDTGAFGCGEQVITVEVTNNAVTDIRGVILSWVECGGDPDCAAVSVAEISYLPAGATVILNGITGRVSAVVSGSELSAPGIVHGRNGSPWSVPVLDTSACYDVVLDADPSADLTVEVIARSRDA